MGEFSMRKKLFVFMMVMLMVLPAAVFAGGFLGLKVGPAAILNYPIDLETFEPEDVEDMTLEDFSFGADMRLNVSILELSALIQGQLLDEESAYLYGYVGLGASLELLGLVDLGLTAGPWLEALIDSDGVTAYFDPEDMDSLNLYIRATADVNLGGLSVGGFLMVDPGVTIGDLQDPNFTPPEDVSPYAMAGVSVLFSLF
jgi:hypothetical protein